MTQKNVAKNNGKPVKNKPAAEQNAVGTEIPFEGEDLKSVEVALSKIADLHNALGIEQERLMIAEAKYEQAAKGHRESRIKLANAIQVARQEYIGFVKTVAAKIGIDIESQAWTFDDEKRALIRTR